MKKREKNKYEHVLTVVYNDDNDNDVYDDVYDDDDRILVEFCNRA
jgi:hypothetical protein